MYMGEFNILFGRIYDDTKKRFRDGTGIYTSKIIDVDIENLTVKTRNSTYKLGVPVNGNQIDELKSITVERS